ncbi:MAG: tRNA 2-thiouridine(34) synthase MnmA [Bacteroidetes bacterium 4484_276]|nr:MAG: tRNA 2-thiouridine(34) synthase MnmA [Bacteroidetes bacterium 4484_276]OYT13917.1 MAG: tRNA 2-thiouridine(34) synthase MnmA [Bacteroidetes bacterium 4572_114]
MKIASLVSGGVDSSVTVHLLKEQGYDPHIFYIKIGLEDDPAWVECPSAEDIEITTFIAKKYGCKFDVISLQEEYWDRVISYTIDSVKKGATPNPDVMCNKMIKFGAFEEKYGKDFDLISTGHYATSVEKNDIKYLGTAKDSFKDQTYFLGQISQKQLDKLIFPIGGMHKKEVREVAANIKLPSAGRKDSQGICFLGKINYNDFIRRYVGQKTGRIIEFETGKTLGKHQGVWFHTIGQRKGLGLSQGPWFVVDKDLDSNIVFVSNGYDPVAQYKDIINLSHFHFINQQPDRDYSIKQEVKFKIRHQPEFNNGFLVNDGDQFAIHSDKPISGVAPGQFGVVYLPDGSICLGSGVIS